MSQLLNFSEKFYPSTLKDFRSSKYSRKRTVNHGNVYKHPNSAPAGGGLLTYLIDQYVTWKPRGERILVSLVSGIICSTEEEVGED